MKDYTINEILNVLDDLNNDEGFDIIKKEYLTMSILSNEKRTLKIILDLEEKTKKKLFYECINNCLSRY